MIRLFDFDKVPTSEILTRGILGEENVDAAVDAVLAAVRAEGDAALRSYEKKFDGAELDGLFVTEAELDAAEAQVDPELLETLRQAAENIRAFHSRQIHSGFVLTDQPGVVMGQRYTPIESVGVCVPGTPAAFPSTVLMDVIPAKLAGVREIIMATPPAPDGTVAPAALAAAKLAGVTKILKCGGAQAVAAMAFGTESVPKVDKIVGPGGAYVAAAKRRVFGLVSIDMIAGPSEILVLADGRSDPRWVAADMLSQAEHDKLSSAVLVTDSRSLAEAVRDELELQLETLPRREVARASIDNNGKIIITDSLEKAAEAANRAVCAAAPHPQCGQRLSGPERSGGAGGLFRGTEPHPAHRGHGAVFQPPRRGRFCEEVQLSVLYGGGPASRVLTGSELRPAGGSGGPRPRHCGAG